jgi:riboflavin kinase/FMN adenylyltransferase
MEIKFPLTLHGTVLHGKKLGSTVDIPTANIVPLEDISGLVHGVYFSLVDIDGKIYKGITNVGEKPTVKDDSTVNAETFIYDYEGDLYEKEIIVKLLEFKRPEMKFDSFEALSLQMKKDLEEGRLYMS